MLSQILDLLKSSEKPLSLDHLSQEIAVERSALEAMLDHLVHKGKIDKLNPTATGTDEKQSFTFCAGCQTKAYCADSMNTPTYYTLKGDKAIRN